MGMKEQLDSLKDTISIEKVVATRSLKTQHGDIFCGLSASFKHDGMGHGVDLLPSSAEDKEISAQGWGVKDVGAVYLYLQHRAYLLCLDSAIAEGSIPENIALNMKTASSQKFAELLAKALRVPETPNDPANNGG